MNTRFVAAQLIASLTQQKGSLKTLLPAALDSVQDRDRSLLQQLCYGTLRDLYRLRSIASVLLRKPFHPQEADVEALLLLGLYQLRSLRMPAHAAVNETVNATADLNKPWARKLLNAVLRNYQRDAEGIEAGLAENPKYRWNHPQWLITKLEHNWPEHWQQILTENDIHAPMCLRVNKYSLTTEQASAKLTAQGLEFDLGRYADSAILLKQACDVAAIDGFAEGEFSVQDQAAQFAAGLLGCQAGQRVLDACAAPGGKLSHLLEATPDLAEVVAVELDERRAQRIHDNLERQQDNLPNTPCKVLVGDAAEQSWWDGEGFDRILVDAPCSGTGVIRRNPDIKLLRQNEDIVPLANTQLAILENLWQMLKPGGRLVYATCSIFPQENERIIERFVKLQPDAQVEPLDVEWGIDRNGTRQLFPNAEHDGFFYAVLSRKA